MTESEADTFIAQWAVSFNTGNPAKRAIVELEIRRLLEHLPFQDAEKGLDDLLSSVDVIRSPRTSFYVNSPYVIAMLRRLASERRIRLVQEKASRERRRESQRG